MLFIFLIRVKFHVNYILFIIQSIYFLCMILNYKNLKFKYLINDMVIGL